MISLKDFFSFNKNRFFWLNLAAMVIVIIGASLGTLHWLDVYTNHGHSVSVPNVQGLPVKVASVELKKNKLEAIVVDSSYVKGVPAGSILEQKPIAGSRVKEGRTIYLTINTEDVPRIAMPDLIDNSSFRQAEAKLRALGFKLTEPEYIEGENGWIYGIKYKGKELKSGEKIPQESTLTLCVGNDTIRTDSLQIQPAGFTDEKPVVDESWF